MHAQGHGQEGLTGISPPVPFTHAELRAAARQRVWASRVGPHGVPPQDPHGAQLHNCEREIVRDVKAKLRYTLDFNTEVMSAAKARRATGS